jgi:Tol biopolymer transport system component
MKFKKDILLLVMVLEGFSSPGSTFYFNQSEPGTDVKIFATNVISVPGRFQQSMSLSADGKEYYYGITDSKNGNYETILCTRVLTNGQTVTETPSFVTKFHFKKNKFIGEPSLAPDGKQLVFVADNPPHIWVATRMENNEWSEAKKLPAPINSDAFEWSPFVSASGTLYFCSTRNRSELEGRIYKCEKENGVYKAPELLKGEINDDAAGDPAVSPDEKFIVFASPKKGGYGDLDLYISYRQPDGTWSKGYNLGPKVNTAGEELGPRISPDGKYLFFYRRDKWQNATFSNIYWTEIKQFMSFKYQIDYGG